MIPQDWLTQRIALPDEGDVEGALPLAALDEEERRWVSQLCRSAGPATRSGPMGAPSIAGRISPDGQAMRWSVGAGWCMRSPP